MYITIKYSHVLQQNSIKPVYVKNVMQLILDLESSDSKSIFVKSLVIFIFWLIVTGSFAFHTPKPEKIRNCTPKEEDGRCVKISDCSPVDRYVYINEDRKTTEYLRSVLLSFVIDVSWMKLCILKTVDFVAKKNVDPNISKTCKKNLIKV